MRHHTGKLLATLAVVSAAVLPVSAGLASADGPSTGGVVHIYEADDASDVSGGGTTGTVILTGAITDYGTDCEGCDGGQLNVLHLTKENIEIDVTDLGNKLAAFPLNPVTCSSDGSAAALVPIVANSTNDTGAYTHIRGSFLTWGAVAQIVPGGQNGVCETNSFGSALLIAEGAGTVSYK
jgi:hypothetical protein